MNYHSARMGVGCRPGHHDCNGTFREPSFARNYRLPDRHYHHPTIAVPPYPQLPDPPHFPAADVPDHAHYIIGAVILAVGVTGVLGNALVIYAFCRSRALRTPGNMFVVNLAAADFLMSLTQSPVFFAASLRRRWAFGERACELYAFCGALFGICSMVTLAAIAADRCLAITRPLAFLGGVTRRRVGLVLGGLWAYSLGWSLPPFFGWSAYVPEGLQTSCSWDYMSFTPSVRAYTVLLFTFVFFVPLGAIAACYLAMFRAVRTAQREVRELGSGEMQKAYERVQGEWKMAKVALLVILLFVVSWSPYSVVALTATAGYSHLLTPYMNSVPAVIAKASAIHNPIIYAITHPKYRAAIARYVPLLRPVLRVRDKDLRSSFTSFSGAASSSSSRRATITSQSSLGVGARATGRWGKSRLSSASDTESCWVESEVDGSLPVTRRASVEVLREGEQPRGTPNPAFNAAAAAVGDEDVPDGGAQCDGKAFLLAGN
ncbi:melanopsin-like [Anguilla rostrata]|uniref:melanopsin-like n=1 Tax=Anguilla rostrata TaxID=7938 RepID=UPI0030D50C5B